MQAHDEELQSRMICLASVPWVVDPVNMISSSLCITRKGSDG